MVSAAHRNGSYIECYYQTPMWSRILLLIPFSNEDGRLHTNESLLEDGDLDSFAGPRSRPSLRLCMLCTLWVSDFQIFLERSNT